MRNMDSVSLEKVRLFRQTDKKFVADLPRFLYEGPVKVVQSEGEAARVVECLEGTSLLGIDTETRPSFKRGVVHKVALLQISTEDVCFLFRLNYMGLPECLVRLLSDGDVLKVGLSLKDDLMMLRHRCDFTPAGFIDLQHYAAGMGIKDMSLQKLYANVFHRRISKNVRLSNWEADCLTEGQQRYAATDAYTCMQLYRRLRELKETGNYFLVEPEMEPPQEQLVEQKQTIR